MVRAKQDFTTEPRDSDGRLDETVEKVSDIDTDTFSTVSSKYTTTLSKKSTTAL